MFKDISCGWVTIEIGDFSEGAGYLNDIPIDTLEALINSYENNIPAVIKYDTEGWQFIVVIDNQRTYIIDESFLDADCPRRGKREMLTVVNISKNEIVGEILMDIINDLNEWVLWNGCLPDIEKEDRRNEIIRLVEKLNELRIEYEMSGLEDECDFS